MIIVLQQDRNNIGIIQYTHSKTREKQRSTSNRDLNQLLNQLSPMTIESSKDSSKGDNESNKLDCSVDKYALYAHKPIKFNGESNRLYCAIDANAHTVHNPTGNFIPKNTGMNTIQVKDSTFATQDQFINTMSWFKLNMKHKSETHQTFNTCLFIIIHPKPSVWTLKDHLH